MDSALLPSLRRFSAVPLGGLLLGLLLFTGCGSEADTTTLRLGHGMAPAHPVSKGMRYFAHTVDSLSDGKMNVEIYPSEQLGTERQCLELLQIGSLDMAKVSSAVLEGFSRDYRVFGLPYVFRNDKHRFNVLEGEIGREILLSGQDVWLRGLTYYDAGSRSFYTADTPIREPADLKGLKIRVQQSPVAIQMVQELGAQATPISFGELYTALQQGVVEGAENNPPSLHSTRHYELVDYYSLDQHTSPPDVLLISTHTWEDLTEQQRSWVQTAADASLQKQKAYWAQAEREAMKVVKEAGVEIVRPDKSKFVEAVQPLYEQYRKNQPRVYELFQRIRNLHSSDDS
ncbi:C4-dicarboxylate ABC transporter substrate-binding protein [Salinibacter sp. 10B]|uniref:TRAP transporter substrate-binding protein n=1 Tax=Salinibacter sp. 10B TaxID=1923971 RepID=UPI000CF4AF89|nr:TRAP transporter substrate-binding protein [Salinibacter sp. 10B]PQJ35395.1 C4-dicarboxylate ABC transporter substrate-binding protein [Salinibacter sp. 10B]